MLVALMIIYMQITRWHCGTVPKSAERADQANTLLPHAFYHDDQNGDDDGASKLVPLCGIMLLWTSKQTM